MIDKNVNVIKDPKIKRIVEYAEDNKQINVLDSRFYRCNGNYYPSVTSILNFFPKNQFFHSWLKECLELVNETLTKYSGSDLDENELKTKDKLLRVKEKLLNDKVEINETFNVEISKLVELRSLLKQ